MLFLNPRPIDLENSEDGEFDEEVEDTRDHRNGITIASVMLYLILSGILALFCFPISLLALSVPVIAIVHTFIVVRGQKSDLVWPCVLLGFLGVLVKLAAIIVFLSLFDVFDRSHSKHGVLKPRHALESPQHHHKLIFFGIILVVEIVVVGISCCLQWHLVAFKKGLRTQKNQIRHY
ncbi:hypothetical protein L596_027642 [Steinernema carpocapsae]|uniref:Transmembrane protein n=1 Tax=Steinernema carpocapsae TaxID=34508 RepID=A0A4U5LW43_STECR|nr:hypothetical protein L596_027642 [Steinernema carpocapsae]